LGSAQTLGKYLIVCVLIELLDFQHRFAHYRLTTSTTCAGDLVAMRPVLNCPCWALAVAVFFACGAVSLAQIAAAPAAPSDAPTSSAPAILRVEGADADSGTHYVRLSVWSAVSGTEAEMAPRFTIECRDVKGKHDLLWFLSFGGVPVQPFMPPFKPSQSALFPPDYHKVKLKMDFEGYMRTKPSTRAWEELPSGEFRFCNAGIGCPNMETARYYMSFLNALPTLRISFAKPADGTSPEQIFQLRSLVDEANKTPVCAP
jgi:hypothetical protein